jgi:hypothetical protein
LDKAGAPAFNHLRERQRLAVPILHPRYKSQGLTALVWLPVTGDRHGGAVDRLAQVKLRIGECAAANNW